MPADSNVVLYEKQGHKAHITINRPERQNRLVPALSRGLIDAWRKVREDDDVWVAILAANGEHFCLGMDFVEAPEMGKLRLFSGGHGAGAGYTLRRQSCFKPVIAAVNGDCVAPGGWAFIMDADVIICSEEARFWDAHLMEGRAIAVESIGLSRRMPFGMVMKMILAGPRFKLDARQALDVGLVTDVVPLSRLRQEADEIADMIVENPPLALQASVMAMWRAQEIGSRAAAIDQGLDLLKLNFTSEDFSEGQAAMKEGRKPRWKGR